MSLSKHLAAAGSIALVLACASAQAQVEIQFWHSLTGALGEQVASLAERYNQSQKNYRVVAQYKGGYAEAMAAAIAATRAGGAPHLLLAPEAATESMLAAMDDGPPKRRKSATRPYYRVMAEAGQKFDQRAFIPAIASYYADKNGRMLSFPFSSATPVFYFNKEAFRKAGLDPAAPPTTWPRVQAAAQAVRDANASACGFTTGSLSWVHVENLHSWNNELFATQLNGYGGRNTELVFNDQIEMRHIALLAAWLKGRLATFGGGADAAKTRFASGECAMLTASSADYADLVHDARFEVGVAPLPYYEDFKGAPQNTTVGGASLWVMAGRKAAEYKGVAQFMSFLAQPEVQAEWHQATGYLPLTTAAYQLTRKQGWYDAHPGAEVAVQEVLANKPSPISRGLRLGDFVRIRAIIDEELDHVWSGSKPAKQALDDAVRRGDELLRSFEKANK